MRPLKLLCGRCGTALAPAFRGAMRCPRLSACGRGGIVETLGFLPASALYPAAADGKA